MKFGKSISWNEIVQQFCYRLITLFTGLKVIKNIKRNMDLLYLFPNMKSNY